MKTKLLLSFAFALLFGTTNYAQQKSNNDIKKLISSYKKDIRGPYYRIKWYCKDGSVRDSKDPCPDSIGGGIQHASFKESALDLRKTNHLFFGEILASLNNQDF